MVTIKGVTSIFPRLPLRSIQPDKVLASVSSNLERLNSYPFAANES
jgi:hypothetical protein